MNTHTHTLTDIDINTATFIYALIRSPMQARTHARINADSLSKKEKEKHNYEEN